MKRLWLLLLGGMMLVTACGATDSIETVSVTAAVPTTTASPSRTPASYPTVDGRPTLTSTPPTPPWCPIEQPQPAEGTLTTYYVDGVGDLYQQVEGESTLMVDTSDITSLDVSDDGTWVAYVREPEGLPPELWAVRGDGTDARRVLGEPAIINLNAKFEGLTQPYRFTLRWVPNSTEFLVEVRRDEMPYEQASTGVYRLDVERLTLQPFPAELRADLAIDSPISPDGAWAAVSEAEHLSLIRLDGSAERRKVLWGFRPIGITYNSILPPLVWTETGVRVAFPPHESPEADPRQPPFEVWDVPFEGDPVQVDTFTAQAELHDQTYPWIVAFYFAREGSHYMYSLPESDAVYLKEVTGDAIYAIQGTHLPFVQWNSIGTHTITSGTRYVNVIDTCGGAYPPETAVRLWSIPPQPTTLGWVDNTRYFALDVEDIEAQPLLHTVYLITLDGEQITLGEGWRDAEVIIRSTTP